MKMRVIVLTAGLSLAFSHAPLRAQPVPPSTRVVVTFASFSEKETALFVAEDQGFFRKYGLDVKRVQVRSGPLALSALVAGESHFHAGSATGTTLGAIAGGLDAVFAAGLVNKLTGAFVVNPAIKRPSDLKGKNVGVQSMGGGVWMNTMLAFDHWGLDPKRDKINFRVLGDESVLAQSVASGVIDGSYLIYSFASRLERQGFRVLADLARLGIPYQSTAILTRRALLVQSPDVVEKVLRALVEAIAFILEQANKAAVIKSLAKGLRLSQIEEATEGYERVLTLYDGRIYPNVVGIRNAIRLLGTANEKIARLKAEDVVDDRIVKKLEQEGLFKEVRK